MSCYVLKSDQPGSVNNYFLEHRRNAKNDLVTWWTSNTKGAWPFPTVAAANEYAEEHGMTNVRIVPLDGEKDEQ